MSRGLMDDIPLQNKARDKAWEKFIKRKDVQSMLGGTIDDEGFDFPLAMQWHFLWCQAWHRAWDAGFFDGHEVGMKTKEQEMVNGEPSKEDLEKAYLLISKAHTETMLELMQTRKQMDEVASGWFSMLKHRIKWRFNIQNRFDKE